MRNDRPPIEPGSLLAGRYRIERVSGSGSMSIVMAATHLQLGRVVAIKLVRPESLVHPEIVTRFLHEARTCAYTQAIDFVLHADALDVDHVEPLKAGGKDDQNNFALTHASCNRSKQASDLRVARVLASFASIRDEVAPQNRGPNLGDVMKHYGGALYDLPLKKDGGYVGISFPDLNKNEVIRIPLYRDELSGMEYFFAKLPITYLHHDDRINPRAVGGSLNALVEEFHRKRPQLHVALAWAELSGAQRASIKVFDGQHKATAQVLLGAKELPVRIFLNPDLDILLTTNTNAGTTLRQVAFDKSVQRHLVPCPGSHNP